VKKRQRLPNSLAGGKPSLPSAFLHRSRAAVHVVHFDEGRSGLMQNCDDRNKFELPSQRVL
jgi:hypothetical protein